MADPSARRSLIIGISPLRRPDARLVAAVCRAGATGVLDLGAEAGAAAEALARLAGWATGGFGVRAPGQCPLRPADVLRMAGGRLEFVVTDAGTVSEWPATLRRLAEVTDLDQARRAVASGADGVIAKGNESGGEVGEVGELSTFVLLQQLLADPQVAVPVWAAGGIGPHTAAAAVLGGAAGVVLDTALALLADSELPGDVGAQLRRLDGSETTVVDGQRAVRAGGARGPVTADLPVGQDAFLAARFESRYTTVPAAIRAVREQIMHAVRAPAPAAIELGCPLPVLQGPMTRVSDQPAFAAAVADNGGLPFLALALSSAEQTRDLLARTDELMGQRPWGVGVLGFAPEDLRNAQLAAIKQVRPRHAIIAGGRPAQALELEAQGIATFLHVPSPGLLAQFLAAGVRRFVFEGSECGGHVGPRAAFPLWEAQLGVLEDFLDANGPTDVEVVFAGGVQDARSAAAAAAALVGSLGERGVRYGLLMGTAYLFTAEAVSAGAIRPVFQREVLAARSTTLLETAPGHATRVVTTPYAGDFTAAKADLTAAGVPARELWERLEERNLGRLRLASKGVRRDGDDGDDLVEVDEATQHAEGLFMAGQVAVLRDAVTTIAELHAEVTVGAERLRAERAARLHAELASEPPPAAPQPLDIAVVGMECLFPGSPDLAAFWATVLDGADAVTEVPPQRWDAAAYYDEAATGRTAGEKTPSRWGGFLPPIALPFPMPIEVQVGDTVHTVPMSDGSGQLQVPAGSLLVIDPRSKVLREAPYVGEYQQWMKQQRAKQQAAKK